MDESKIYYDFYAEKFSADIAHTLVWEGAVKHKEIKDFLIYVKQRTEDNFDVSLSVDAWNLGAEKIAELFENQLDSGEAVKTRYLPTLRFMATTDSDFKCVAVLMLRKLLYGVPMDESLLVSSVLPKEVYFPLLKRAVVAEYRSEVSQGKGKVPCFRQLLTAEEFQELLKEDMEQFQQEEWVFWLTVVCFSPRSICGNLHEKLSALDLPWCALLTICFDRSKCTGHPWVLQIHQSVMELWSALTNVHERRLQLEEVARRSALYQEQHVQSFSQGSLPVRSEWMIRFEDLLDAILEYAKFPVDDLNMKNKPCLLICCPDINQAVKLFQHTLRHLNQVDLGCTVQELTNQNIDDERLAALLATLNATEIDDVNHLSKLCAKNVLPLSCAELLKIDPYPTIHPFMRILWRSDEKNILKTLELLNPDLNAPNCLYRRRSYNALHIAGIHGFTTVCKEILVRGFDRLLMQTCTGGTLPVSLAVTYSKYSTAQALLQAMDPREAERQFISGVHVSTLHKVMREIGEKHGENWTMDTENEFCKNEEVELGKKEIQERVNFQRSVLDTTVEGQYVDVSVLTKDAYNMSRQLFTTPKTLYQKIAESDQEQLKSHECFTTLTNFIWTDYGFVQGFLFSLYLLFMVFLTTSLALAARSTDPTQYDDGVDQFRLFCEIVTLICVLVDITLEIYELGRAIWRSWNHNNRKVGSLLFTKDVLSDYFLDWTNLLDILAILCILLIIPFRITDSDVQWVFTALAFMFHGLRIFKYAIMFQNVGEYVAILALLIKRDIPQFVTVFLVIIVSLGGALYFSLIGHYDGDNIDTENNNDTSEVYLLWWAGFRILVEGSALTYTGPGGFNFLGILIYWLFLFIVVVVLLNILIAQFSKSYEEETEKAQINVILTRTKIIFKMERSPLKRPFVHFVRKQRMKRTRTQTNYEKMKRRNYSDDRTSTKPASSKQVEDLKTKTTNFNLQLRKQIDGTSLQKMKYIEDMVNDISKSVKDLEGALGLESAATNEMLQSLRRDMEEKFLGLERRSLETWRNVDEMKKILLSMTEK